MTGGGRILSLVLSLVTTRCVSKAQQSIFAKPAYFPRTITSVLSVTSVVKASHPPEFLANPATNDCEPTRHNPPRQQGHRSISRSLTHVSGYDCNAPSLSCGFLTSQPAALARPIILHTSNNSYSTSFKIPG
ncbi:hypothetical protein RB11760 [Rhodopirellula baltica SH 1]|uniref:Uncharacterized protein n=1 Tax=Rhodopirellula baltica (strain DSM 10527 / NCIMB 13988 / SH1) TaxID=243090 RepID=Q7UDV4_RHOBA|nr:hypothetical protein RB11760 [Rhodopirellula baltica SH 1]